MRVLRHFYFFTKRFHTQKKYKNANKQLSLKMFFMRIQSTKTWISDFHSDDFYSHKKHKNMNKRLSRRWFLYAQKAQKSQNMQNFKQVIFFFLDVFFSHTKNKKYKNMNRLSLRWFLYAQKAQKSQKMQNFKQVILFFLDVFMLVKILSFFVHIKSIETQISE